jgi:hypothetical protein
MTSEVTELIAQLRAGKMTLDEVAQRFRERSWLVGVTRPSAERQSRSTALDDPEPYVPGSFDDVSAALHRKDLTLEEYAVLARAAADSINAEDRRRGAEPSGGLAEE